jgi:hypothetical protein
MNFESGEIAILDLSQRDPSKSIWEDHPPNGAECELQRREFVGEPGWDCIFPGHPNPRDLKGRWWVPERMLRKRRPPSNYKDQFTPCEKGFNWKQPQEGMPIVMDKMCPLLEFE